MRLFYWGKDGGPESKVWGFWLIEAKNLFSIALLKFEDGSREAFHDHAFNAWSWVLSGKLKEFCRWPDGEPVLFKIYKPSWNRIFTPREFTHMVKSVGNTWVLTFRGPWDNTWHEWVDNKLITLTHGRKVVA